MLAFPATSIQISRLTSARLRMELLSCPVTVTRPKLRIEAPLGCASRSITTTRRPRLSPASAWARPTMPAPTIARSYVTLSPRQGECLDVGVGLHRLDDALLVAVARVFDAAERAHLDAVARDFPDVDRADLEAGNVLLHAAEVVGAHTGGKAKGGRVGKRDQRIVIVRRADDRHDRAEGFLHHELGGMRHAVDDDRRQERTLAAGVVEDLGTGFGGHVNALFEERGGLFMDDGAQLGRPVHRIAELQLPGALEHQRHEAVGDLVLNEDALHRRAALARVFRGTGNGEVGGLRKT